LPQWEIVKLKAPLGSLDPDTVLDNLASKWHGKAQLNTEDGLRIDTPEWWVHMRKSNTEPIIRVIGEGVDVAAAKLTCQQFLDEIVNSAR
jgi:phosphomannomutase